MLFSTPRASGHAGKSRGVWESPIFHCKRWKATPAPQITAASLSPAAFVASSVPSAPWNTGTMTFHGHREKGSPTHSSQRLQLPHSLLSCSSSQHTQKWDFNDQETLLQPPPTAWICVGCCEGTVCCRSSDFSSHSPTSCHSRGGFPVTNIPFLFSKGLLPP